MSQSFAIFRALKRSLRQKKITYRMIAEHLELSESTVKRLFADQDISIGRLEKICGLAGMEISDLIHDMENTQDFIDELSDAQEKELASDARLLLATFLVLNGLSFESIKLHYKFGASELMKYLVHLDRMKMIDLYPDNRVRIRVSPSFKWRRNGPIQKFFVNHLLSDFIDSSFSGPTHSFHLLSGLLSERSIDHLSVGVRKLVNEFNECILEDNRLPFEQRKIYSLVLAMRDWQPAFFEPMRN